VRTSSAELTTRRRPRTSVARSVLALRKRLLFVCVNRRPDGAPKGSCAARGSIEIHAKLKDMLKQRGLAAVDVRTCTSSCLDTCWAGPSIAVEPDHYYYGRVALSDVPEIVDALAANRRVERLVLSPEDFIEPKELRRRESEGEEPR